MKCGNRSLRVHAGFHRNVRSTRWQVVEELRKAARGESLLDGSAVQPMEALYITGHSLGGAMAAVFALLIAGDETTRAIWECVRAIYTFGQPLAVGEALPDEVSAVAAKTLRHINARDVIPALPAAAWGRLAHFGEEYRRVDGEWTRAGAPVAQLEMREIPRSLFGAFGPAGRKKPPRYSVADHGPHEYIAALRPAGRLSELGDDG
jgi:hypothetical protein